MKVITGNALDDGRVIYLGKDDAFVDQFIEARLFDEKEVEQALALAQKRVSEIADLYVIEAQPDHRPGGREALKETIRSNGPTTHLHFGKQAEKVNHIGGSIE